MTAGNGFSLTPIEITSNEEIEHMLFNEEKRRRDHGFKRYMEEDKYM